MFKSNKGFTLVELIVVIAILAILAGIAIPAYSGYIKKAQDAAVVTELDAIATAAQAANATEGEISKIVVNPNGDEADTITVTVTAPVTVATNYDADFVMFYTNAKDADTSVENSVTFKFKTELELKGTSYETGANWTKAAGWKAGTN